VENFKASSMLWSQNAFNLPLFVDQRESLACYYCCCSTIDGWMDVCIEFQTEENGEHLSLEFNEI